MFNFINNKYLEAVRHWGKRKENYPASFEMVRWRREKI